MRSLPAVVLALILAAGVPGCREDAGAEIAAAPAGSAARGAPAADAGEMCAEHGVLKVLCTKHNPKLAAVFQAKGDWCAEHELPESFCPICHPERGGRPAADVSGDGAPADGTKVRFKSKDIAALAGIRTVRAAPGGERAGIRATARIAYDATRLAHLNPRAPGVVRALKADVGSVVKAGDVLAVIDSPDVGATRSRLEAARLRVKSAEEVLAREQALLKEGLGTRKAVLEAQQALDAARGELSALGASLSVLGGGAGGAGGYVLASPIAGVVTQRGATIGELVREDEVLFEVVDTSSMWAELDVPEIELPVVAAGQPVVLRLDGLAGREIQGTISYVAPAVDPRTRTGRARVPLQNPEGVLRANLFGEARIDVGEARAAVMVPREAVQRARGALLVFVRLGEDSFEARRVQLGAGAGELVEIRKGVRLGEEVVTQGGFLLKTETLKESIGAGCCEAD